jgi:hypothetical protein
VEQGAERQRRHSDCYHISQSCSLDPDEYYLMRPHEGCEWRQTAPKTSIICTLLSPLPHKKIPTMATPPPSPLLNNNAIAALQTAAGDPSTPYRPSTGGAVARCCSPPAPSVSHHHSVMAPPSGHILASTSVQMSIMSSQERVTITQQAP